MIVLYCALGVLVAAWGLADQGVCPTRRSLIYAAAEIGIASGTVWWLIARWLPFGSGIGVGLIGPATTLIVRAVLWGLAVGLWAAWRLEHLVRLPGYRTSETVTRLLGPILVVFAIATAAERLIQAL